MSPERVVRYADSGGYQIAYEAGGDGPLDIVLAGEIGNHLDLVSEDPRSLRFGRRLTGFGRVIHMDPRGVGLSDPMEQAPLLEERVDDLRAVLSAVGSEGAALVGHGYGAQLAMLFAATHPNQTTALVSINGYARLRRAPDYPWGYPPQGEAALLDFMAALWGTGSVLSSISPGLADGPRGLDFVARLERSSATPRRAVFRHLIAFELDVRDVLPAITAPTLVIQSSEDTYIRAGHARYLVDHIAGAKYVEVPGADHTPYMSPEQDHVLDAIEEFLTGAVQRPATDRALRTVAFTDIVDSTRRAAEFGDRRWRDLMELHDSLSHREIEAGGGRLIKFTGDGLMATFEGPARAVRCMQTLGDELEPLGLPIRAGLHTGEVELLGDDIGGIAVHIAARISALAGAGEVLTSSTVRDLVAGSGLEFDDRGEHELKGVPGLWRVLAAR